MSEVARRGEQLGSVVDTIVARATYLHERIHSIVAASVAHPGAEPDPGTPDAVRRHERWTQVVGQGDPSALDRRLRWAGVPQGGVGELLAPASVDGPACRPAWAGTLEEIMHAAAEGLDDATHDPPMRTPFAAIYRPAVAIARRRLRRKGSVSSVGANVHAQLEAALYRRLVWHTARALLEDFDRAVGPGYAIVRRCYGDTHAKPVPRHRYDAWVRQHRATGLAGLYTTYPVMARHVATLVDHWVDATLEFIVRLGRDRSELERTFGGAAPLGPVVDVTCGVSDPHRGGRSVVIVRFRDGARVVYKPRSLGLEAAHTDVVRWCNERSGFELRTPRVLPRADYGWIEFVEHAPCPDDAGIDVFYQRAGARLCLLFILGGTDYHAENVICTGDDLVPVDSEALLYPRAQSLSGQWRSPAFDSVIRTGLLPVWDGANEGPASDMSGIGGGRVKPRSRRSWTGVGTDAIRLLRENAPWLTHDNALRMADGRRPRAVDHLDALTSGFRGMYRAIQRNAHAFVAPGGPLAAFANNASRFIYRPTRIYAKLLERATAPRYLRSGVEWSIELDHLAYAFCLASEPPGAWPVLTEELAALHRLDVPYFVAATDTPTMRLPGGPVKGLLRGSGLERAAARVRAMNDAGLQHQLEIVRAAFLSQNMDEPPGPRATDGPQRIEHNAAATVDALPALGPAEASDRARAIGDVLASLAIRSEDRVGWLGLRLDRTTDRFTVAPLGNGLFDGRGGVLVFLAALGKLQGDGKHDELVARGIDSITEPLRIRGGALLRARGETPNQLGGAEGLGSLIYCLARLSDLTGDPRLLDDASVAASAIRAQDIEADRCLDVLAGCAGALLGLVALYRRKPSSDLLMRADACARHLLAHRVRHGNSPRAWQPAFADQPLTGFSHGAAGISYALLRLYEITGDTALLAAAREGQAYERSRFSDDANNWPDLRPGRGGGDRYRVAWCNGGPGIALARLGGLAIDDLPQVRDEVEAGLAVAVRASVNDVDHVCCGNFGRLEVMLEAASTLGRPDAALAAARRARWALNRADRQGSFQLQWYVRAGNGFRNPGFFQGLAGVGHQLLRLAHPGALPSVLLWQ